MMKELADKHVHVPNEVVLPFANSKKYLAAKPTYTKHFLYASNMSYSKGTDIAVGVFRKYKEVHQDAKLVISGYGAYKTPKIEGLSTPGFVDPAEYFKKASFYIIWPNNGKYLDRIWFLLKFLHASVFVNNGENNNHLHN